MTQKITIKLDNKILEGFDNISVTRNIESLCGTFSFNAFSQKNIILPFNPSQSCNILVDDQLFLTGIIDRVFTGYTDSSHTYNINGRDQTSMIVDNSIEGNINFSSPVNLAEIIQALVGDFETQISVFVPAFSEIEDFKQEELTGGDEAENLFEFIEKLSRQRGILIRTNEEGNIILEKGQGSKYKVKLLNEINGTSNNILEGSLDRDHSQRFKRYKAHSQTNMSSGIKSNPDYNVTGIFTDTGENVLQDKFLEVEAEISGNSSSNLSRAEWESKIRAARSEIFSCKLEGFIAENVDGVKDFWAVNRLIDVKDDFLGINKTMLIKDINFNYSNNEGAATSMQLVDKNAYILGT
jgi:prophage tail gpP-like protein